jgi:uncharacterized protein (DUF1501 family)
MLFIGHQRERTCQTLTRRAFLQAGGSTALGLSLADLLRCRAVGGTVTGSAKSVIFVWLWGGPSHIDTWDPKPDAPLEYRGPFSPIATKVAGIRICELFPRLAQLSDRFSIIRSMHTDSNDHGVAGTIGLTGSMAGALDLGGNSKTGNPRPTAGSVIARARGFRPPLPPFMVIGGRLHQGKKTITGEGGGSLGGLYDPFRLEYDPEAGVKIPALQLPVELSTDRLGDRKALMHALDKLDQRTDILHKAKAIDDYRAQAFAMLISPAARRVFDLSQEPAAVAERYGRTRFGQSCLLARRLIENGVPFVQVNWSDHVEAEEDAGDGGWDLHYRNFQIMQDRYAAWLDQSLSALFDDLDQRGLLATTMVVATGEFGRTPKINDKAGRDHWEHCYSSILAGGGIRGGRVIGSSDHRGEQPRDHPATPADIATTIFHSIGLTSEQLANMGLSSRGNVIDALF